MLPPTERLYSREDFFNRFYKWLSSREDGYFFQKWAVVGLLRLQRNTKPRAFCSVSAVQLHRGPHAPCYHSHQREPEAYAGHKLVLLEEAVEDALIVAFGNALARVRHSKHCFAVNVRVALHADEALCGELHRVAH